jgi:YegS/Rv2252/BmrU family lipid kinase
VKVVAIINPISGTGADARVAEERRALVADALDRRRLGGDIHFTEGAGHARELARAAADDRRDLVIVWGGDGTVNEAGTALLGTETALGLVPAGSGNGLAAALSCSTNPRAALDRALDGATRTIDAGMLGDRPFFNIAGIGVDAVIAARFAERGPRQRGPIAYLQLGVSELLHYRAQHYSMIVDGEPVEQRAMLLAVANGRQYGNRVCIAPGARLDDGLLELVAVDQLPLLSIAARLPSLFRGTLRPGNGVTMRAVRNVRVRAGGPIPFHVDGEPRLGADELIIATIPRALTVKVASTHQC